MKKNVILIDYENVQNVDLKPLLDHDVLIKVFHNESQKFSSTFTRTAMEFGRERMELIQISGSGKNAADFHIAYVLGRLAREIDAPFFHIISKDNGFKPLVNYMKNHEKIECRQEADITHVMLPKNIAGGSGKDYYKEVIDYLSSRKSPKPKKMKTLRNQIVSICHKKISGEQADEIIQRLIDEKVIVRKNDSISYPA
ncbi:MAG: hypothetical protein JW913_20065 [Chitinispirillaceae bacterium]|nr:hypothetical protein [Chitinispirillaceae bacterium]